MGFTWVYKDLHCLKRFCVTPCTPLQTWSPDDLPTNKRLEFEHLSRWELQAHNAWHWKLLRCIGLGAKELTKNSAKMMDWGLIDPPRDPLLCNGLGQNLYLYDLHLNATSLLPFAPLTSWTLRTPGSEKPLMFSCCSRGFHCASGTFGWHRMVIASAKMAKRNAINKERVFIHNSRTGLV